MIRILIVDDHQVFAEALGMAIDISPDLECVGVARTLQASLELAAAAPDVVVVDYDLPSADGIEYARRLVANGFEGRFLMLSAHLSTDVEARAGEAGIQGFLHKSSSLTSVLAMIREVAKGRSFRARSDVHAAPRLSKRQREVLELMGEGADPAVIAERLYISTHTARGHVKAVMKKLGASSQLEAVVIGLRSGLLLPPKATAETAS